MILASADLGGGRVRRTFTFGDKRYYPGMEMTGDELRRMPIVNRNAMVENRLIEVWPVRANGEMHVVHVGRGLYDVIRGVKLNGDPLSKEEAEALAMETAK